MNATEALEKRIDELCKLVYLADMRIEELEDDNERLRQDNAKLRGARDLWQENDAKLRELVRDYHTFLALADLAQPIGHIIAASGHPTLSIESLDSRCRELGIIIKEV